MRLIFLRAALTALLRGALVLTVTEGDRCSPQSRTLKSPPSPETVFRFSARTWAPSTDLQLPVQAPLSFIRDPSASSCGLLWALPWAPGLWLDPCDLWHWIDLLYSSPSDSAGGHVDQYCKLLCPALNLTQRMCSLLGSLAPTLQTLTSIDTITNTRPSQVTQHTLHNNTEVQSDYEGLMGGSRINRAGLKANSRAHRGVKCHRPCPDELTDWKNLPRSGLTESTGLVGP